MLGSKRKSIILIVCNFDEFYKKNYTHCLYKLANIFTFITIVATFVLFINKNINFINNRISIFFFEKNIFVSSIAENKFQKFVN